MVEEEGVVPIEIMHEGIAIVGHMVEEAMRVGNANIQRRDIKLMLLLTIRWEVQYLIVRMLGMKSNSVKPIPLRFHKPQPHHLPLPHLVFNLNIPHPMGINHMEVAFDSADEMRCTVVEVIIVVTNFVIIQLITLPLYL